MSENRSVAVGHVDIVKLQLYNYANRGISLAGIRGEIRFKESIFSNTIEGEIDIADAAGVLTSMPLTGQEFLDIEYKHIGEDRVVKKSFYVYKLSNKKFNTLRSYVYTLYFTSKELILSENLSISEAFNGKISSIVEDIMFREDLLGVRDQKLVLEKTKNEYKFISPFWKPFGIINWLTTKAINDRGVANYQFFETNQSYEFSSIDTLMSDSAKKSAKKYVYSDANASTSVGDEANNETKGSIVPKISRDSPYFDYLDRLRGGMYGSELEVFDIIFKKITLSDYNYFRDFKKANHLENFPLHTSNLIHSKKASLIYLNENHHIYDGQHKQNHKDYALQNMSLMKQINAHKMTLIDVPGTSDIKAGSIIDLTIPTNDSFGPEQKYDIVNKYFSGKYLVCTIKHKIDRNIHTMDIEIAKDSVITELKENT